VVTLPTAAAFGRVVLDGQDISKYVRRIEIVGAADDLTTARIEYVGAIAVEAEPGRYTLEQAKHLVVCSECDTEVQGTRVDVVDVTPMQPDDERPCRQKAAVVQQ
jgi:hypothetical protein